MDGFSVVARVEDHLIKRMSIIFLILFSLVSIWMYFDLKRFRTRGVPVRPGLFTGTFVFLYYLAEIVIGFGSSRFFYAYSIGYEAERYLFNIVYLMPLVFAAIYFLFRRRFATQAAQELPPLPPAPRWHAWFFVIILLLPIIAIAVLFVFLMFIFRAHW